MKKSILFFCVVLTILSAFPVGATETEMVVLLDRSESLFSLYDEVIDYLFSRILRNYLDYGDSFHLLTFAGHPEVEITQDITSRRDIEQALSQIMLIHPLGQHTDFVSALQFLYQYTYSLSPDSRKVIIVLSDGIHDPPPGSPFEWQREQVLEELSEIASDIRAQGWEFHFIRFPLGSEVAIESNVEEDVAVESDVEEDEVNETGSLQTREQNYPEARDDEQTNYSTSSEDSGTVYSDNEDETRTGSPRSEDPPQQEGSQQPENTGTEIQDEQESTQSTEGIQAEESGQQDDFSEEFSEYMNIPLIEYAEEDPEEIASIALAALELQFPENIGRIPYSADLEFTLLNYGEEIQLVRLEEIIYDQQDILEQPVFIRVPANETQTFLASVQFPEDLPAGPISLKLETVFRDNDRVSPTVGRVSFILDSEAVQASRIMNHAVRIALPAVFVLVILAVFILMIRRIFSERYSLMEGAAHETMKEGPDERGVRPLELRVDDQNRQIGMRNIHYIPDGNSMYVGCSDQFIIFIYKVPHRIAEIQRQDELFIFKPLKQEYFPDIGNELKDCVNVPIKVRTEAGKEFYIRFIPYVSQLEEINRILSLTRKPGKQI
ncbi:MAG: VWA domain-containing protein [Spirochaetia bacterium]